MRKTLAAILFLLTTAGLSSCSDPRPAETANQTAPPSIVHFDFGQPIGMTRAQYADYLEEKARDLAESEMARLSAIELAFRDKLYYYGFEMPATNISHGAYAKMYRQFTGYELLDISNSDSLFHPILFTIEFKYDILVSEPVFVEREGRKDAQAANINKNYYFHRSDKALRIYPCDEKGSPQLPLPPPLDRPNYWDTGTKQMEVFSLHEVEDIRATLGAGRTSMPQKP